MSCFASGRIRVEDGNYIICYIIIQYIKDKIWRSPYPSDWQSNPVI